MGALLCASSDSAVSSSSPAGRRSIGGWLSTSPEGPEDGRLHFVVELPKELLAASPERRRKLPQSSLFNALNSGLDGLPSRIRFLERLDEYGSGVSADAIVVKYSVPAQNGASARELKRLTVLEPSVDGTLGKLSRRQYSAAQHKLSGAVARVRKSAFEGMLLQRLFAVEKKQHEGRAA
jgi:hypothetical protein